MYTNPTNNKFISQHFKLKQEKQQNHYQSNNLNQNKSFQSSSYAWNSVPAEIGKTIPTLVDEDDDYNLEPPPIIKCNPVVSIPDESMTYRVRVDNIDGIDEKRINDLFGIVGGIKSVNINVESSPQYAIVEYYTEESANKAIKKFNGKKCCYNNIYSKELLVYRINDYDYKEFLKNNSIDYTRIAGRLNKQTIYKIKVDNIDGMNEKNINDLFGIAGNMKGIFSMNVNSIPQYAIIEYYTEESADKAIQKFNGKKFCYENKNAKMLFVYRINDYDNPHKIFINNLSKTITEERLKCVLSTVGEIKTLYIDRSNADSITTTAEIEFYERKKVEEAKEFLEDTVMDGIAIEVKICENKTKEKSNYDQLNTVFVGCLSEAVSEADLRKTFEKVGEIHSIKIFRQKSRGECPDYAYVNFVNRESMAKAVKDLNGLEINGRFITVQYSKKKCSNKNKGTTF